MARRVTIAHIADAAGVSVPTVSKVVNGRSDVAPHTRERVERITKAIDMIPPLSEEVVLEIGETPDTGCLACNVCKAA
jgi:transcriptional regulator with XRE-family HTH domain